MNAYWPIYVTKSGMVIDVKAVQPKNAYEPIDVTEVGMVIDWVFGGTCHIVV